MQNGNEKKIKIESQIKDFTLKNFRVGGDDDDDGGGTDANPVEPEYSDPDSQA